MTANVSTAAARQTRGDMVAAGDLAERVVPRSHRGETPPHPARSGGRRVSLYVSLTRNWFSARPKGEN